MRAWWMKRDGERVAATLNMLPNISATAQGVDRQLFTPPKTSPITSKPQGWLERAICCMWPTWVLSPAFYIVP